jgi:hypothetical protein
VTLYVPISVPRSEVNCLVRHYITSAVDTAHEPLFPRARLCKCFCWRGSRLTPVGRSNMAPPDAGDVWRRSLGYRRSSSAAHITAGHARFGVSRSCLTARSLSLSYVYTCFCLSLNWSTVWNRTHRFPTFRYDVPLTICCQTIMPSAIFLWCKYT